MIIRTKYRQSKVSWTKKQKVLICRFKRKPLAFNLEQTYPIAYYTSNIMSFYISLPMYFLEERNKSFASRHENL